MSDGAPLHRILARQLRRLNLAPEQGPPPVAWRELLDTLSATYHEADDERYTLERSIEVSSREMRDLHVLSQQATTDHLTGPPNRRARSARAGARRTPPPPPGPPTLVTRRVRVHDASAHLWPLRGNQP